ncbi:hypothetical protein V9T40_006185 [Parthenolecanium corni]|uniref:Uncharacterized protein n=1 Tax=Parthenolecanium corni TaxID=536013 RepID=A0AAN9YB44_9HEMI
MASLPESPVDEEIGYDLIDNEPISIFRPVGGLDDLCKQTKFTRQEIRVMYRGFKQELFPVTFLVASEQTNCLPGKASEQLPGIFRPVLAQNYQSWTFKLLANFYQELFPVTFLVASEQTNCLPGKASEQLPGIFRPVLAQNYQSWTFKLLANYYQELFPVTFLLASEQTNCLPGKASEQLPGIFRPVLAQDYQSW